MSKKKAVIISVVAMLIVIGMILVIGSTKPSLEDYVEPSQVVEKVEFDIPINEIESEFVTLDDNEYTLSDLPQDIQDMVILGAESEDVAINCYYAYTKLVGKVKSMDSCDKLVIKTYDGYRCKYYMINNNPVLFIYNDNYIYIDDTQ